MTQELIFGMRARQHRLLAFTADMDAKAYVTNELVQAAVERKFEVIGEALNQLSKWDAARAARIQDLPQVVAFRNQLIHGYATINPLTVWNIVRNALPGLLATVQALFDEPDS